MPKIKYPRVLVFISICFISAGCAVVQKQKPIDADLNSDIKVIFTPAVFSGKKFPSCDFEEPRMARAILGPCELTRTFYDAGFNKVTSPTRMGRYGAIVEVRPRRGKVFRRFVTLYREPGKFFWREADLQVNLRLPADTGISPDVLEHQPRMVNRFIASVISDGFYEPYSSAVYFAWLHETSPQMPSAMLRDSPEERDARWWYHLKKETGDFVPYKYLAFLPKGYTADERRWPLVLFLHGSGERGDDLNKVESWGIAKMGAEGKQLPFIAICPQCPNHERWLAEELNDFLDDICAKYRVDPKRIYVTGLSMGGYGTWSLIQQYPNRFAAAIPIAGGGDPLDVERIKKLPIWDFHGSADDTVPVEQSREMVAALRAVGGNIRYTEFPGVGHPSWVPAYATKDLFPWMLAQHR